MMRNFKFYASVDATLYLFIRQSSLGDYDLIKQFKVGLLNEGQNEVVVNRSFDHWRGHFFMTISHT